jgi:secondary thiamine-phosphate synthase enzyme
MQMLTVKTGEHAQLIDMTSLVQEAVREAGIRDGRVVIHVPHTTAAVTINENADPAVVHDLLTDLDRLAPWKQPYYQHGEGNSAAHLKSSLVGCSMTVLIENGNLVLGTWQGIYFCEFDGPRIRKVMVKVTE